MVSPHIKAAGKAYIRLAYVMLFYPAIIAALICITVKGWHWGFGAGLVVFTLIFDPLWRAIFRRFRSRP